MFWFCLVCYILSQGTDKSFANFHAVVAKTASRQRGVCVEHLKRCKTSNLHVIRFSPDVQILVWFSTWISAMVSNVNFSRGHKPIVDTCANEAIPQWGKRRLITSVYLHFSISEMATGQAKNRHVVCLPFQTFSNKPSTWCQYGFRNLNFCRLRQMEQLLLAETKQGLLLDFSQIVSSIPSCQV